MKMSLSLFAAYTLSAVIALAATPAHAQSVAKSGQQCMKGAEQTATELDCGTVDAGPDVRLYVQEFTQCDAQGNIIASSFDRDIMVRVPSGDYLNGDDASVSVKFSPVRTHIDWITGDNYSMILPQSAVVKDGANTVTLKITTQTELDNEDAADEESHFIGTFVETGFERQKNHVRKARLRNRHVISARRSTSAFGSSRRREPLRL